MPDDFNKDVRIYPSAEGREKATLRAKPGSPRLCGDEAYAHGGHYKCARAPNHEKPHIHFQASGEALVWWEDV